MTQTLSRVDAALEQAAEHCNALGERFTPQRKQVLALLLEIGQPVTAYQLLEHLREQMPGAQPPTVYRALEFLQRVELVHRIDANNTWLPCALDCGEHEHGKPQLLVCADCGRARELPLPEELHRALAREAARAGFQLDDRPLALQGICEQCRGND